MNLFVGNIVLKGKHEIETEEFDTLVSYSDAGDTIIFMMGELEIATSQELLEYFTEKFGSIESYDISISTEDQIELFAEWYDEGIYEVASFEGERVEFEEICERFEAMDTVCTVREAEESKKFGNRIVKVDFIY